LKLWDTVELNAKIEQFLDDYEKRQYVVECIVETYRYKKKFAETEKIVTNKMSINSYHF